MAGMSSLIGTISTIFKWSAQNNQVGSVYSPISNASTITKNYNLGTAATNAASGGADEVFSFQQAIAPGGSATVDLTAMTNLLGQSAVTVVRIKGWQIRLLNVTDDPTITAPAASAITVTNNGPSVPCALDFATNGSGLTLNLTCSVGTISSITTGSAGSGYPPSSTFCVIPQQAGGSGGLVAVTTNSGGVPTTFTLLAGGSGYSNATVPTVISGYFRVQSGGAHEYFDVSADGFAAVSATAKNVKIFNNDAVNTATFELSVFGCTT